MNNDKAQIELLCNELRDEDLEALFTLHVFTRYSMCLLLSDAHALWTAYTQQRLICCGLVVVNTLFPVWPLPTIAITQLGQDILDEVDPSRKLTWDAIEERFSIIPPDVKYKKVSTNDQP